jgi:hypothetical protein
VSYPETSHPDERSEEACLPAGRELVINKDYQRFGTQIIPMNEVRSLPLIWQELNKLLPIANRQ